MSQNTTNSYISKSIAVADKIDIVLTNFKAENAGDLISFTEEIISNLFNSILLGEFIKDDNYERLNSFKDKLDISPIENILSNDESISEDTRVTIEALKKRITLLKSIIFYSYLPFAEDIKILLSNQEKDTIFVPSYNKYKIVNNDHVFRLFFINISLCLSDISFNETQDCFESIASIKDEISSIETIPDLRFLKNQIVKMDKKATFLLFKWCKRAELSGVSLYIDKGIENYEDELKGYGGDWISLVAYINNHYYDEKNPKEKKVCERNLKESFAEIDAKDFSEFSCRDIHLYIKYHKDIVKDIDKLDKIIDFLEDWKEEGNISQEEKNVRETIYHYAINNRFSLFTGTCENRKNLRETYKSIYNKDNKNYFLQYKFIDKSIQLINDELSKSDEAIKITQIQDIENYLAKTKEDYKIYKTNIEWILEHIYFIYRVSFDECVIDDIFIYSSFLLPLDNRKSKDGYERIADSFRELKSQLPLFKKMAEFDDEVSKVKKELFQFDEKIEKHDTKTIELMGLFSAIIAFIMGSIPTIQYIKGIYDIGIFFIVFATSLISFLLVLLLITRKTRINKRFWLQLILIVVFYVAMTLLTIFFSNEK